MPPRVPFIAYLLAHKGPGQTSYVRHLRQLLRLTLPSMTLLMRWHWLQ
jgi:hypothetical protein